MYIDFRNAAHDMNIAKYRVNLNSGSLFYNFILYSFEGFLSSKLKNSSKSGKIAYTITIKG